MAVSNIYRDISVIYLRCLFISRGLTNRSDLPWSVVGLRPYFIWSQHQPTNAENCFAGYDLWLSAV